MKKGQEILPLLLENENLVNKRKYIQKFYFAEKIYYFCRKLYKNKKNKSKITGMIIVTRTYCLSIFG